MEQLALVRRYLLRGENLQFGRLAVEQEGAAAGDGSQQPLKAADPANDAQASASQCMHSKTVVSTRVGAHCLGVY